jgi:hypothetical protein
LGQAEQERQNGRAGHAEQDSQIGQAALDRERDRQNKTRICIPEQDRQNRIGRAGQAERD